MLSLRRTVETCPGGMFVKVVWEMGSRIGEISTMGEYLI